MVKTQNKIALVMSGGAFNGAFQWGVLDYLNDNWQRLFPGRQALQFDIVTGVSVGALNGVMIASNGFQELDRLWNKVAEHGPEVIYTSDFLDTSSKSDTLQFRKLSSIAWRLLMKRIFKGQKIKDIKSLGDIEPLKRILDQIIDRSKVQTSFRCGLASLADHGAYYYLGPEDFSSDKEFRKAILASAVMPIVWAPVDTLELKSGEKLRTVCDGGVRNVTPLKEAIALIQADPSGSDYTIIIVNCANHQIDPVTYGKTRSMNIGEIALRAAVQMSHNEIQNDDIRWFLKINDMVRQVDPKPLYDFDWINQRRSNTQFKKFESILIEPDTNVMGDELVATKKMIERRKLHGIAKAKMNFP